jgi:AcrR family transcriptional regulator
MSSDADDRRAERRQRAAERRERAAARRERGRARTRQPLNAELIVDTALRIADEDGVDAVSMRRIASELRVGTMSLYHHVGDK